MSDTEPTLSQHRGLKPWQPGQSGNPAGRQKGSRNKLGEAFLAALHDDFIEHGVSAIVEVRETKPDQYLKVIASTLTKDVNLNITDDRELTDDELLEHIRELDAAIAPFLASRKGEAGGTGEAEAVASQPSRVH